MTDRIHYTVRNTSLGPVAMAASANGVCFVEFGENEPGLLDGLKSGFPRAVVRPVVSIANTTYHPHLETWMEALVRHLDTGVDLPAIPVDIRGSEFEVLVWNSLRAIPEGQVVAYRELAATMGRPDAVRAVASACGRNRIAVLIPCHRVVRSDGQLGGYRWGLSRKRALLDSEHKRRKLVADCQCPIWLIR